MVRPGSSSIQGIDHFGRPCTLRNPGSTGELPTVRLMQLMGMILGSVLSNRAGDCGGPKHPAAGGQRKARLHLFDRRQGRAKVGLRGLDLRLAEPLQVQPSGVQSQ